MSNPIVWFPDEEKSKQTRLYKWMKQLGYHDYDLFYNQSIKDTEWFWNEVVKQLDIRWFTPYESVLETKDDWKYPNWFTNGQLNIVETALDKWANNPSTKDKKAIISERENGKTSNYSFFQLQQQVERAAAGFKELGMDKGDVTIIYLPMIPEAVISMLALAKIGCIACPIFSGYAADAITTRIQASSAKYMITAAEYQRRGKTMPMKKEADEAVAQCPTIEKVIVVHAPPHTPLHDNRDVQWESIISSSHSVKTVHMNSHDPLMLLYTSGTTGKPKGAVHTHSGFPIKAAFDAGICMDVNQDDTFFWYSDMGWMMGPFLVFGGLVNGATIVLYEGVPDYPNPDRIWQICSHHHITHLGISPTLVRSLMTQDTSNIKKQDLSSLKVIGTTGEPWNPAPWMWLFRTICKGKVPILNYSGGTEISGGILGNILLKPISPITFNSPILGMNIDVYSPEGTPIMGKVGELVIKKPWVGMTNSFWKDNSRYEEAYWSKWNRTWVHGDWVIKDSDGFWTINGRSDDVINIAGKRIGPAEIESSIVAHPHVSECATIGVPHSVKGECAICFVTLTIGSPSDDLKAELMQMVATSLGRALKPDDIHFVPQLPKTRNGKIMRRVIKAAFLQRTDGDLSTLENKETLEYIRLLGKKEES